MATVEIPKDIRQMLRQMPKEEIPTIRRFLQFLLSQSAEEAEHPAIRAMKNARVVDEPLSKDDRKALDEAYAAIERGDVVSHEEVRKILLGEP